MSQESIEERIVGSFASLLSSAVTFNGDGLEALDTESSATIPRFLSSEGSKADAIVCTMPSLRLKHSKSSSLSKDGAAIGEVASRNLALPVTLNREEVENAPMILLTSLADSFLCLVDSRLRSALGALIGKTRNQNDPTLTRVIVGLLASSSNPITPSAVVTSFRVLPTSHRPTHRECVLPLVMETVVDMNILGSLVTVNIVAPGTIQGFFCSKSRDTMLSKVEVIVDTTDFLKSMMNQARFVVRNAISVATDTASKLLLPSTVLMPSESSTSLDLRMPVRSVGSLTAAMEHASEGGETSLMPPPPCREPSRKSLGNLRPVRYQSAAAGTNNASWPAPAPSDLTSPQTTETGLSLLTAAAAGMKHPNTSSTSNHYAAADISCKRQRTADSSTAMSSRVPSCPSLTPV